MYGDARSPENTEQNGYECNARRVSQRSKVSRGIPEPHPATMSETVVSAAAADVDCIALVDCSDVQTLLNSHCRIIPMRQLMFGEAGIGVSSDG